MCFLNHLQPLKQALSNSMLNFRGEINQDASNHFRDHSQLLHHVQNQLLHICNARCYKFNIRFFSGKDTAAVIISSILQMQLFSVCPIVGFYFSNNDPMELPIETISNWLNRRNRAPDEFEVNKKFRRERFLHISVPEIQNGRKMCDNSNEVIFIFCLNQIK